MEIQFGVEAHIKVEDVYFDIDIDSNASKR